MIWNVHPASHEAVGNHGPRSRFGVDVLEEVSARPERAALGRLVAHRAFGGRTFVGH
jgi:hypothetical protein